MIAALASGLALMWGVPIVASALGLWGQPMLGAIALLAIAWFLYFGIASFRIACPRCGFSIFSVKRGPVVLASPWPRKRCSGCGESLTNLE